MFSTASALPANQVAYYNFDQGVAGGSNAGITSLTDQSGNGRAGTLTNFTLTGTHEQLRTQLPHHHRHLAHQRPAGQQRAHCWYQPDRCDRL